MNARGYCAGTISVWRGPIESAATAGALSLLFVLMSTGDGFWTRPALAIIESIPSYAFGTALVVVGTAIVGLLLGLLLAGAAVLTLSAGSPRRATMP